MLIIKETTRGLFRWSVKDDQGFTWGRSPTGYRSEEEARKAFNHMVHLSQRDGDIDPISARVRERLRILVKGR